MPGDVVAPMPLDLGLAHALEVVPAAIELADMVEAQPLELAQPLAARGRPVEPRLVTALPMHSNAVTSPPLAPFRRSAASRSCSRFRFSCMAEATMGVEPNARKRERDVFRIDHIAIHVAGADCP